MVYVCIITYVCVCFHEHTMKTIQFWYWLFLGDGTMNNIYYCGF